MGKREADEQYEGGGAPEDQAHAEGEEDVEQRPLSQRFRQSEEIGKHHGLHGALLFRPLELALLVQLGGDYG